MALFGLKTTVSLLVSYSGLQYSTPHLSHKTEICDAAKEKKKSFKRFFPLTILALLAPV